MAVVKEKTAAAALATNPGLLMRRRDLIRSGVGAAAASVLGGCSLGSISAPTPSVVSRDLRPADIYIPGYEPSRAFFKGQSALDHPQMMRSIPQGYEGPISMLTKFSTSGAVRQTMFPVRGHDIAISADRKIGVFGSMEGRTYVTFDATSLDLITTGDPFGEGWIGGGHGAFLAGGELALCERAPKRPYAGRAEDHFGRVTIRNPKTLKVLGDFSTHGISPHEIRLLADGVNAAIANYGSTVPPGGTDYGEPRHVVEASVTIVDIQSGQLVEKYRGNARQELRHLCVRDAETIFAIQTEIAPDGADRNFFIDNEQAYEDDPTGGQGVSYLEAPTVRLDARAGRLKPLGAGKNRKLMREGLSIEYDPMFDEVIASYPATHTVLVFDANSGDIKSRIDCASLGLSYPCGIALLPGQNFYVVAGYWRNIFVFERGVHQLQHELSHYPINFGHSHMVAV